MPHTVCYFTDTTGFGGAEQALLTLIAGLDRGRWRPTLIYHPSEGVTLLLEQARQLAVTLWSTPPMPDGLQGARRMLPFTRALRTRRPAVFHAHLTWQLAGKYGLLAAISARVPAIVATEQLYVDCLPNRWVRLQQRLLALGVGRYLAVSHEVARRLRATYQMPEHKLQVIYNAVTLQPLTPASRAQRQLRADRLRAQWTANGSRPLILTLARLDKQKGYPYLLQAATLVPEAMFICAGEGSERATLETQARTLGLADRVLFLGQRSDVPDLLAGCDVFVLPSLYEGLPLSVLEAMAAGKPVIATRIGGTDEAVVDGETGLLVPPADPHALAQAIRALLDNPALAQRLATAGQASVHQKFSAETMVQRTMQVYEELLGRRNR